MKAQLFILVLVCLAAYFIEAFSVLHNFLSFGPAHNKVQGLNDVDTLLSNNTLIWDIAQYYVVGLCGYVLVAINSYWASLTCLKLGLPKRYTTLSGVAWLGATLGCTHLANSVIFPHSFHSTHSFHTAPLEVFGITTALIILLFTPLGIWLAHAISSPGKKRYFILGSVAACSIGYLLGRIGPEAPATTKPNIIILGVDSLRPDHLADEKFSASAATPFLDSQLRKSVWYKNAYTPLARTYPAWATLLTGQYPTDHQVRFSLTAADVAKPNNSIAKHLKNEGYSTLYAMDERRFSYIDEEWGFEKVIGPKPGASDFALGSLHDITLLNLLSLVPFAEKLLPITTHNRAVQTLYSPNGFARYTADNIERLPSHKPALIAVHLCLPHWPFGWRNKDATFSPQDDQLRHQFYSDALTESDAQLQTIWNQLQSSGRLKNAIVIFMSDHGEGHGFPEDMVTPSLAIPSNSYLQEPLLNSYGHGTNLLAITQNKILLAIRDLRVSSTLTPQKIEAPVSLLDVAPTVSEATERSQNYANGASLLDLDHIKQRAPTWQLYLESGFTVSSMRSAQTSPEKVAQQSMQYYSLSPKGRLAVRKDLWQHMIQTKQLGLLSADDSLLLRAPSRLKAGGHEWHFYDGTTNKLSLGIVPNSDKVKVMKEAILQHFVTPPQGRQ